MNDDPRRDDPTFDETARRVQDAVTAHGRSVQPDEDGSLAVIRHRVAIGPPAPPGGRAPPSARPPRS